MCDMYMLFKSGTVCLRVADPHFVSNLTSIRTFQSHLLCLLPEDIALALKKVLSICPIPLLPAIISGGDM